MSKAIRRSLIVVVTFMMVLLHGFSGHSGTEAFAAGYAKKISLKVKNGQDITEELQNALNEAEKCGRKKKQALVSVPAGTYYISRTVNIGSYTCLSLDKKTVIKKNPNPKNPILYMLRSKAGEKGGYSDTTGITVKGGTWDAGFIEYNATSGGTLFFFAHTNSLTISKVTLCNNFGTHLIEMGGVKDVKIKDCILHGFKAPDTDTEKEAVQLDVCHNESILPAGAPYDDSPCTNVTVSGCEIYDYPRAVGSHMMVEGIYHSGIKITGNNIHDIDGAAVYGYNYVKTTIKNNKITGVGCGIQIKTDSVVKKTRLERLSGIKAMSTPKDFDINITGNVIRIRKDESSESGESGGSTGIFIYGSETYPMSGVSIGDNTVECNSSAVYLRYVNDAVISELTADRYENAAATDKTGFAEDAIKLLACRSAVISDNKISTLTAGQFENGIALRDNSSAELNRNTVNAAAKYGIVVFDGSILGTDNTINDSADNGIKLDNSKAELYETRIDNAGGHGIKIQDSELKLENGHVNGSKEHGITSGGESILEVTGLNLVQNRGNVVQISSGRASFDECTFSENGDTVIQIKEGAVTVRDCDFCDNFNNAIQVKSGNAVITGNTFRDNCIDAPDGKVVAIFADASVTVSDNVFCDHNSASEIWVAAGAETDPYIQTAKSPKVIGTEDAAGNRFE